MIFKSLSSINHGNDIEIVKCRRETGSGPLSLSSSFTDLLKIKKGPGFHFSRIQRIETSPKLGSGKVARLTDRFELFCGGRKGIRIHWLSGPPLLVRVKRVFRVDRWKVKDGVDLEDKQMESEFMDHKIRMSQLRDHRKCRQFI